MSPERTTSLPSTQRVELVYIVGTSHKFQIPDGQACSHDVDAFRQFIDATCKRLSVAVLAEECSKEALQEKGCSESTCQQVARSLSLRHEFCDPDRMVRKEKGIRQESEVDPLNCLTKEERRKAIRNEHAKREKIWLDKLRHLNIWPVLFVCGAEHVNPFCELLKKERLTPKVVCGDWSPKGTDPW